MGKNLTIEEFEKLLFDFGLELASYDKKTDTVSIELTAERQDLLSPQGLVRALKAYTGINKGLPKFKVNKSNYEIYVDSSVDGIRNFTLSAIIKNLKIDEDFLKEIIQVQEKMHQTYGRGRKNFAIGIYPLENIKFPIYFKADYPKNIRFIPLGETKEMDANEILKKHLTGIKYKHLLKGKEKYAYFIDSNNNILSMPPIINSETAGRVTTATKDIFIEVSGFDLFILEEQLNDLVTLFSDMKGDIYSIKIIYPKKEYLKKSFYNTLEVKENTIVTPQLDPIEREITVDYINNILGLNLKEKEVKELLERMMYSVEILKNNKLKVKFPKIRTDIWHSVDIADDVARAYRFSNFKYTMPKVSTIGGTLAISDLKESIANLLVGLGFIETYTFALTSVKEQFEMMNLKTEEHIELQESAEKAYNMVRKWLIPEELKALKANKDTPYPHKIFETGYCVIPNEEKDTLAENRLKLAVLISSDNANFTQINQVLQTLAREIGLTIELKEKNYNFFIEGRSAEIYINKKSIGFIGEIHPQVLDNYNLAQPVAAFELDLEATSKPL